MRYDIRVRNIDCIDKYIDLEPDIISIGDEGCFNKIASVEKVVQIKQRVEQKNIEFCFVTPKVFDRHFDKMIAYIDALSKENKNYKLVINDIGLLNQCKKQDILPKKVALGRCITRSFMECPWFDNFLRDEDDDLQRTFIQNYMAHKPKLDFYTTLGVSEVEANMLEKQEEAYQNISDYGWKVNVHYGLMTVSYSRICQTAKYHDCTPGDCEELCDKRFTLEMTQIHDKRTDFTISKEAKERVPDFILIGNILYRDNPLDIATFSSKNVDTFIISDFHFESFEEFITIYKMMKEEIVNE